MTAAAAAAARSVAARPVAALRRLRGATGRRGVRRGLAVALFLGGLLALGLFCGGDAQAMERPSAGDSVVAQADEEVRQTAEAVTGPEEVTALDADPDPDPASQVRSVAGDVSGGVQDVTAAVGGVMPEADVPSPSVDALGLPLPTEAPQVPEAAEATSADHPSQARPQHAAPRTGDDAARSRTPDSAPPVTVTAHAAATAAATAEPAGSSPVAPAAPGPLPCGGGALPATAADGGAPRGAGDQHAVADRNAVPGGPVRGSALPATAAPTHDRPHDALEFPG